MSYSDSKFSISAGLQTGLMIKTKWIFEAPEKSDGIRILVDSRWPAGLSVEHAAVHLWLEDIAPSTGLRRWYDHIPQRWEKFRQRYLEELRVKTEMVADLSVLAAATEVTLLFSAPDIERNSAVALVRFMSYFASNLPIEPC
jgi:uncharacterized protein YeaO (DUF488 family)